MPSCLTCLKQRPDRERFGSKFFVQDFHDTADWLQTVLSEEEANKLMESPLWGPCPACFELESPCDMHVQMCLPEVQCHSGRTSHIGVRSLYGQTLSTFCILGLADIVSGLCLVYCFVLLSSLVLECMRLAV